MATGMFDILNETNDRHDLAHTYQFFFLTNSTDEDGHIENKSTDDLHCSGSFNSVEQFWSFYSHLTRPGDLPDDTDCCLFKDNIKPLSDDEANRGGGKWTLRLRKGLASRMWEELVLAIIGGAFNLDNEICGAVVSVRADYDIISVWTDHKDREATLRLREVMMQVLNVPPNTSIEFKRHGVIPCAQGAKRHYDARTLLAFKQHCKQAPLYVWESLEAASELRSGRDGPAGVGGRETKFEDAADDDGADAGFQVMGGRKDRRDRGDGGGTGDFMGEGGGAGRGRKPGGMGGGREFGSLWD